MKGLRKNHKTLKAAGLQAATESWNLQDVK